MPWSSTAAGTVRSTPCRPHCSRRSSSWAWILVERRMYFLYNGCFTDRSTSTVTVLLILSLTTRPTNGRIVVFATFTQEVSVAGDVCPSMFIRAHSGSSLSGRCPAVSIALKRLARDSCPVPFCIRRLKASRCKSSNSFWRSPLLFALNSRAFIIPQSGLRMSSVPATWPPRDETPRAPTFHRHPASRTASDPAGSEPPSTRRYPCPSLAEPPAASW